MKKLSCKIFLLLAGMMFFSNSAMADDGRVDAVFQNDVQPDQVNPRHAMFRSFVLPGWGQYYTNTNDWRTGVYYMTLDAVLITSVTLLAVNSGLLNENMYTFARSHSGTDLEGRSRQFQLALGTYNSLAEYNAFNERTFNWERMFPEEEEFHWQWESQEHRQEYQELRNRRDRVNRQIPTVISLMVANRIVSGLSSFVHARNHNAALPEFSMHYQAGADGSLNPVASLRIRF